MSRICSEVAAVVATKSRVDLHFPLWTLRLPATWVDTVPRLHDFLIGVTSRGSLDETIPGVRGLLTILEQEGAISAPRSSSYALTDVRDLFKSIARRWYARYYSHPIWNELRGGTLPRSALVDWLIHNYHVSRSAGVSDARCATKLPNRSLRSGFIKSALEEFSHCDDFYFVRHEKLQVPDDDVRSYVRLASSLAFDQQMLQMAECDWLGHVLVSLFQESTIQLMDDFSDFYEDVEKAYGIPDFFVPWKAHVALDFDYEHASRFEQIINSTDRLTHLEALHSLHNAAVTVDFLIGALDEIFEGRHESHESIRLPIANRLLSETNNALVPRCRLPGSGTARLNARNAKELADELVALNLGLGEERCRSNESTDYVRTGIATSAYAALSYCDAHVDIIGIGRFCACVQADALKDIQSNGARAASAYATSIRNYLMELARQPVSCAFILYTVSRHKSSSPWLPFDKVQADHLEPMLSPTIDDQAIGKLVTEWLCFRELFSLWDDAKGSCLDDIHL